MRRESLRVLATAGAVALVAVGTRSAAGLRWSRMRRLAPVVFGLAMVAAAVSALPAGLAVTAGLAAAYVVCLDAAGTIRPGRVLRHQWWLAVAVVLTTGAAYVALAAPTVRSLWMVGIGLVVAAGTYGLATRGTPGKDGGQ